MNTPSQDQSNTNLIDQTEAEDHRLTISDLRNFEYLSEDLMFDLTNEEFEKMMGSVDSSACIEPLYFHTSFSEYETQCLGYY
jgi:hypothetical protein